MESSHFGSHWGVEEWRQKETSSSKRGGSSRVVDFYGPTIAKDFCTALPTFQSLEHAATQAKPSQTTTLHPKDWTAPVQKHSKETSARNHIETHYMKNITLLSNKLQSHTRYKPPKQITDLHKSISLWRVSSM